MPVPGAATLASETIRKIPGPAFLEGYYPASYIPDLETPGDKTFLQLYKERYKRLPQTWPAS